MKRNELNENNIHFVEAPSIYMTVSLELSPDAKRGDDGRHG